MQLTQYGDFADWRNGLRRRVFLGFGDWTHVDHVGCAFLSTNNHNIRIGLDGFFEGGELAMLSSINAHLEMVEFSVENTGFE